MEKITADDIDAAVNEGSIHYSCEFYNAEDVDAYRAAVKALVETTKTARTFLRQFGQHKLADMVDKAIAAVERLEG